MLQQTIARSTLNGIAKVMSVQQGQYGQGFAGENAIIRYYENIPSQNYNYNYYAPGNSPLHNQEGMIVQRQSTTLMPGHITIRSLQTPMLLS